MPSVTTATDHNLSSSERYFPLPVPPLHPSVTRNLSYFNIKPFYNKTNCSPPPSSLLSKYRLIILYGYNSSSGTLGQSVGVPRYIYVLYSVCRNTLTNLTYEYESVTAGVLLSLSLRFGFFSRRQAVLIHNSSIYKSMHVPPRIGAGGGGRQKRQTVPSPSSEGIL